MLRGIDTRTFAAPKVKQVSENPLAKQPVQKRRAGEWEQMETRILEISINKICRYATTNTPSHVLHLFLICSKWPVYE